MKKFITLISLLVSSILCLGQTQVISSGGPLSCAVLDTAICSSVITNGNPSFLSGSGAVITVDGSGTSLTYFVGGAYQIINSALTITVATPNADAEVFILAKQNLTNPNPVSTDLVYTYNPPCWSYLSPNDAASTSCAGTPTGGVTVSATNPKVWFDLATNTTKICTSSSQCGVGGTGPYTVTNPMIPLGVAVITSAPATRAVLCEPFRLNHYNRVQYFGFANTATIGSINSTITLGEGILTVRGVAVSGGKLTPGAQNSTLGVILYSQTPIIVTNSGQLGDVGLGLVAGAGSNAATGGAGVLGGFGGTGGGGGGGTANTGGAGGAQFLIGRFTNNSGANGGTAGNVGGTGSASSVSGNFSNSFTNIYFVGWRGASGGGGAGNVTDKGGDGGKGGGVYVVVAPSILIDTGCTATMAGAVGANGNGTLSGGGGGGGGGLLLLAGGFVINNGTVTAVGGLGGTKAGTGGDGGPGGNGYSGIIKLW